MATNTNPFYTYSATAGSSKTLQKPQDGGDNNQWGNYINTDLDEIVSAVNALSDKIADASENTLLDFTSTGSAVNHVGITNAATGNPPQISSAGSDTNVDLTLTAQGTGDINLTPGTNGDVNIPASKGITFGDDGEKIEGDGTDLTIASSNDLNLTATTDINVPANVGVTFGDDGEKIEGDGTDLTIASSATLNVNTGSSSGNDLKVNTSQLVVEGDTGDVGLGLADPEELLHLKGTEAVIKLEDSAVTGEGFIDFDGSSLQLNTHRNPNTGANPNSKAPASIILSGNDADSSVKFYTKASNSGAATERMAIDKDGSITTPNGEFNGTIGSSVRGTMVSLADQTVTNSTLVAITLPSTSNVQRFVIQAAFYGSATDNVTLIIKNSSGTAFTCRVAGQRNWSDGSTPNNLQNNATSGPGILVVYNTPSAMSHANIILSYGSASTAPFWEATCSQYAGAYSFFDNVAAYATSSGIVTSVEFDVVGSSTLTGNYKLYGIKT